MLTNEAEVGYRIQKLRNKSRKSLAKYKYDPVAYVKEKLEYIPWKSYTKDQYGQKEILQLYIDSIRIQEERRDYELGLITLEECTLYDPNKPVIKYISIDAGHSVGKIIILIYFLIVLFILMLLLLLKYAIFFGKKLEHKERVKG